jgi:hypothetical protein
MKHEGELVESVVTVLQAVLGVEAVALVPVLAHTFLVEDRWK